MAAVRWSWDERARSHGTQLGDLRRDNTSARSLESCVVQARSEKLEREALRLARQRAFLREERKKAREEEQAIERDTALLDFVRRPDWWPGECLDGAAGDPARRVRLRVGGELFEVSKDVLCKDPGSLLCALCAEDCPLMLTRRGRPGGEGEGEDQVDGEREDEGTERRTPGTVVVDRDWWLFRLILCFLRDGVVPRDRTTALQLYKEASFWRLESLERAIEEAHLNLSRKQFELDDKGEVSVSELEDKDKFWKSRKNWWESTRQSKEDEDKKTAADAAAEQDAAAQGDWWTSVSRVSLGEHTHLTTLETAYNERAFAPLSSKPGKVVTKAGEDDAAPMLSSTWGYYGPRR